MDALMSVLKAVAHTVGDVVPIIAIIVLFQAVVLRRSIPNLKQVVIGFGYVLLGLAFFLEGLDRALFPLGIMMAEQLTAHDFLQTQFSDGVHWQDYMWMYLFAASLGFACTIAEPSLIAVAVKAREVSGGLIGVWGLRIAVAVGVAIGLIMGTTRIVLGLPLQYYIIAAYVVIVLQTFYAPRTIIPLAYDLGGVTTSTVTVPLVTAIGIGLAGMIPGRSPLGDGFGLIALAVLFPIMTVMAYAQLSMWWARRATRRRREEERGGA